MEGTCLDTESFYYITALMLSSNALAAASSVSPITLRSTATPALAQFLGYYDSTMKTRNFELIRRSTLVSS